MFQFGDTFWRQLTGTAMGAPLAPTYANSSFATHELTFVPNNINLLFYCQYIDHVFAIWFPDSNNTIDNNNWNMFQHQLNGWGGLEWEINDRTDSVVFLDLTLSIRNNKIHSMLYEKPLNLHLYLPARSAHPLGVLHGLVAGHIYRAFSLCTDELDAIMSVNNMFIIFATMDILIILFSLSLIRRYLTGDLTVHHNSLSNKIIMVPGYLKYHTILKILHHVKYKRLGTNVWHTLASQKL